MSKSKTGWVITGNWGLYSGWHHSRRDAINAHVANWARAGDDYSRVWRRLKRNGDRAVKITIQAV